MEKDLTIEDYRLEILLLQKRDQELALEQGFTTRRAWLENILKQDNDEVAEAIIDMARRYEVPVETVASNFDPATMTARVLKVLEKQKSKVKGKAA